MGKIRLSHFLKVEHWPNKIEKVVKSVFRIFDNGAHSLKKYKCMKIWSHEYKLFSPSYNRDLVSYHRDNFMNQAKITAIN